MHRAGFEGISLTGKWVKSRKHDLDGAPLMTTVFSKNKPIRAFNDLTDKTDEDEQEGMMHLFVGAVLGLRNPRAHALLDDSAEMALEYIGLISLGMSN
jgi:uncharacterized protein (TIGR02391 family)